MGLGRPDPDRRVADMAHAVGAARGPRRAGLRRCDFPPGGLAAGPGAPRAGHPRRADGHPQGPSGCDLVAPSDRSDRPPVGARVFVAAPLGLLLSAAIASPYFGTFDLNLTDPVALVPGLIFSLSNAIGEDVPSTAARSWPSRARDRAAQRARDPGRRIRARPRRSALHGLAAPGGPERGVRRRHRGAARAQDALIDDADRGPHGDRFPVYAFFACRNPLTL